MSPSPLRSVLTVIGHSVQEGIRRRVFLAVLVLTVAFLALYALGAHFAFRDANNFAGGEQGILDPQAFTGATIFGLAMFATLFLGAVLAVFLTLGGSAATPRAGCCSRWWCGRSVAPRCCSRVSPAPPRSPRPTFCSSISPPWRSPGATGDWSPDHLRRPGPGAGLWRWRSSPRSRCCRRRCSPVTAQGIVVFMVFGAGLTAGLLAQIGNAINSDSLHTIGRVASWALPFEGLYAAGLHALISSTSGLTGVVLQLGPFGGSEAAGPPLIAWAFVYMLGVLALAALAFSRRDL